MKVKNPSTGNFEEVYVKALDSLPVGSEIDFTGSASDIPVGWEEVTDLIVTENISITNISMNANQIVYKSFTIPSKTGYTAIGVSVNSVSGAGSGYTIATPTLGGDMAVFNGYTQSTTISISLKVIYLKN